MKSAFRAMALVALLAGSICVSAQDSQPSATPSRRTTSGIDLMVVALSGAAVPKAKITILDDRGQQLANGMTNRWGKFSVSQVPPGAYEITVGLEGFKRQTKTFLVHDHEISELTMTLQNEAPLGPGPELILDTLHHGNSALDLTVKDENGAVIPRASVSVLQMETSANLEGATDEVGTFRANSLASDRYTVTIKSPGFNIQKATLALGPHETREVTITLSVGRIVIGDPYEPAPPVETQTSTLDSELIPEPPPIPNPVAQDAPHTNPIRRFFHKLGF